MISVIVSSMPPLPYLDEVLNDLRGMAEKELESSRFRLKK
jgi:hypothetical protein